MERRLTIFTRYPEPGKTKTRLIPALGPEGAAQLQRDMTRHTLALVRELAGTEKGTGTFCAEHPAGRSGNSCLSPLPRPMSVEVRFEGGDAEKMAACFGNNMSYRPQGPGDLGSRMAAVFVEAFREGADRTVLIGADCPEITPELIRESFERLAACDLVLGPANDGGYYLIGLRRPAPELFSGIAWSSERVFENTLRRADELALDVSLLKTLSDVDRPEDLAVWHRTEKGDRRLLPERPAGCFAQKAPVPLPMAVWTTRISVIIPTLNEADYLPRALGSLRDAENLEVIVADGGSTDGTSEMAHREGCRVLRSPPGRAAQMNAGAGAASGSILLFLHADTCLPPGFDSAVLAALQEPGAVAGAFRLRIGAPGPSLRLIEQAVDIRSRVLQMPYGDQGIFVLKETFQELGGFAMLPIMEDFEFVRRLRRRGRIRIASLCVTTSGRRWQELGSWRTTWINQKVILGYCLGVSPERLAAWYARRAERALDIQLGGQAAAQGLPRRSAQ